MRDTTSPDTPTSDGTGLGPDLAGTCPGSDTRPQPFGDLHESITGVRFVWLPDTTRRRLHCRVLHPLVDGHPWECWHSAGQLVIAPDRLRRHIKIECASPGFRSLLVDTAADALVDLADWLDARPAPARSPYVPLFRPAAFGSDAVIHAAASTDRRGHRRGLPVCAAVVSPDEMRLYDNLPVSCRACGRVCQGTSKPADD